MDSKILSPQKKIYDWFIDEILKQAQVFWDKSRLFLWKRSSKSKVKIVGNKKED